MDKEDIEIIKAAYESAGTTPEEIGFIMTALKRIEEMSIESGIDGIGEVFTINATKWSKMATVEIELKEYWINKYYKRKQD